MNAGNNVYFREIAVTPTTNLFTLLSASSNCPLSMYGSDIDFNSKDSLSADVGTDGNITIREWGTLSTNAISNVSQVSNAYVYISGSFIV